MITKLVDRYNPGITLLVLLWVAGFAVRQRLATTGSLGVLTNEAFLSLLYVIPVLLGGWATLSAADKFLGLGILRGDEPDDH
jgi:hypothetical protein